MAPSQTSIWDHAFSLLWLTRSIPPKIVNFSSKFKFDGEGKVYEIDHFLVFENKCKYRNIFANNEKCKIFVSTFKGKIKSWYEPLLDKSIHTWKKFMEMFLIAYESYIYDELCNKIESVQRENDESMVAFYSRISWIYCRFHDDDWPLEEEFIHLNMYLLHHISLLEEEC